MEVFLSGIDQRRADKSTEKGLDGIEKDWNIRNGTVGISIRKRRLISWRYCLRVLASFMKVETVKDMK